MHVLFIVMYINLAIASLYFEIVRFVFISRA